jgi:hypothetical protein
VSDLTKFPVLWRIGLVKIEGPSPTANILVLARPAGNSYCSLSPARPFIEASADLSEELPIKRRRTEVSVPIGSHGAHRQAQFQMSTLVRTAGAIGTRIVHVVARGDALAIGPINRSIEEERPCRFSSVTTMSTKPSGC